MSQAIYPQFFDFYVPPVLFDAERDGDQLTYVYAFDTADQKRVIWHESIPDVFCLICYEICYLLVCLQRFSVPRTLLLFISCKTPRRSNIAVVHSALRDFSLIYPKLYYRCEFVF